MSSIIVATLLNKIYTNLSNELNSPILGRHVGSYPTHIVNAHIRHISSSSIYIYTYKQEMTGLHE